MKDIIQVCRLGGRTKTVVSESGTCKAEVPLLAKFQKFALRDPHVFLPFSPIFFLFFLVRSPLVRSLPKTNDCQVTEDTQAIQAFQATVFQNYPAPGPREGLCVAVHVGCYRALLTAAPSVLQSALSLEV